MPQVPLNSQDVTLGQEHIPGRASEDTLHEEASVLPKVRIIVIRQEKSKECALMNAEQRVLLF